MVDSNHRRRSRRFYSPLAPSESPPADQRIRVSRRDFGLPPSAMRPWVPGPEGRAESTDGHGSTDGGGKGHGRARKRPRTGPLGAVRLTVLTRIPALTCHFRMPARFAVVLFTEAWLCVLGAESVGDALVGCVGLAVDAVGVDLQQDRDAVPGAAGDLGRGHPGVQPQRHRRVPQVIGAAAERRPVLGRGEGFPAGLGPRPRCSRSPAGGRPSRSGRPARPGSSRTA